MKLGFKRGEKGFTLVEIIIVLAVIAVLAAVVIPNVTGFLGRGKERGWGADRDILQAAVDSYRTDIGKRAGNPWPTLGGLIGTPSDDANGTTDTPDGDYADTGDKDINQETGEDLNSFIDIAALANEGYLKGADVVKSAETSLLNTTATNTVSGSYGWYINSNGVVDAIYWNDKDNDDLVPTANVTDEVTSTSGFVTDVYP
jgi:prepilin-type N-terminal cleavage/methylation domain-containing protein